MQSKLRAEADELNHRLISVEQESNRVLESDLIRAQDDLRLNEVH